MEYRADIGVAFDGDGDRVAMVDDRGEIVDGDELLYVIAANRKETGEINGPVVGTVMSNFGLEEALNGLNLGLDRAKVGDRYVLERMRASNATLGGETSGHIIVGDRVTTGDAIVSALQVLLACRRSGRTLHQLKQGMHKYPQVLVNVRMPERRSDLLELPSVCNAVAAAESTLAGQGRVLLRPSGTEPVLRVMVEGRDEVIVGRLAASLADSVRVALGGACAA
jgi:phosphoglucosamine mutase